MVDLKKQNKFLFLFLIRGGVVFLLWLFLYDYWLSKTEIVDNGLIFHLISVNREILELFSFDIFHNAQTIGIDGSHGVFIGAPCNGMNLFALFSGFIVAFHGKVKYKIPYIFFGLLLLHMFNICRIYALILLSYYSPGTLDFNHKYTFTIMLYFVVFGMWILWVKKYANKK